MTGRELIIYILENGLEDEKIFADGKVIGYMTIGEAAAKLGVGPATVHAWIVNGWLEYVVIADNIYIPVNTKAPKL